MEPRVGELSEILVEGAHERPVIRGYGKGGESFKEELALLNGPDDGQAFQLDGSIPLLGRGEGLGAAGNDGVAVVLLLAEGEAHAVVTRCICEKCNLLFRVEVPGEEVGRE